jgi:hypothetical protein
MQLTQDQLRTLLTGIVPGAGDPAAPDVMGIADSVHICIRCGTIEFDLIHCPCVTD